MKHQPNFLRTVLLTALALALPFAGIASAAPYANDGAFQKADGTWGIPYAQCSVDSSYITRAACRSFIITQTTTSIAAPVCPASHSDYRSSGACDDGVSGNATDCATAGHIWYAPSCDNPTYTDQTNCVNNGGTWTYVCRGAMVWIDNVAQRGLRWRCFGRSGLPQQLHALP